MLAAASLGAPLQPQNILADYAGGGSLAVMGILAALPARAGTGHGQEIDVGMLDGAMLTLADLFSAPLTGIGRASDWRATLGGDCRVTGATVARTANTLPWRPSSGAFAERSCASSILPIVSTT